MTAMASTGLRTLCLAYHDFAETDPSRPADFFDKPHGLEEDLTALCIVGIKVRLRGGWERVAGGGRLAVERPVERPAGTWRSL